VLYASLTTTGRVVHAVIVQRYVATLDWAPPSLPLIGEAVAAMKFAAGV